VPPDFFIMKLRLDLFKKYLFLMEILIVIITAYDKSGSNYLQKKWVYICTPIY